DCLPARGDTDPGASLPSRPDSLPDCAETPASDACHRAARRKPPASVPACVPLDAAPAGSLHPGTSKHSHRSAGPGETGEPPRPDPGSVSRPSARSPLRRSGWLLPDFPVACASRAKMPPGSTARPPPPAAETVANHGAENSSREYAQPAAGWCRSGSQNPARSSRCDRLAVGHAAVRTAPSPHSDRVAAPTAARKTAARLASSARTNPQKLSFISARKCWKCSLIGIIFAIGCRPPFQERLLLVRQSQLTPSRLLHNQRYVTRVIQES